MQSFVQRMHDITHHDHVLLRADLNVPLEKSGTIANDFRLRALLPTLTYILNDKRASVTILTHLGRPTGFIQNLSTKILAQWFSDHGYPCFFASTIDDARQAQKDHSLIMLENVRLFPGEQKQDYALAQTYATLGTFYVLDAFGATHRNDTSLALTAEQFDCAHRSIGFLIEKEIASLQKLITDPQRPFVAIIGGGKVTDKIPLIRKLCTRANTILLCPAISSTFLAACDISVGISLIDRHAIPLCNEILKEAASRNVSIVLPLDYQIAHGSIDGPLEFVDVKTIPDDGIACAVGPHTLELYCQHIMQAKTIFYNGLMGFAHRPETLTAFTTLAHAMGKSTAWSVVAGGDSVSLIEQEDLQHDIDFLSTGGGAALAYINGEELPALVPFIGESRQGIF